MFAVFCEEHGLCNVDTDEAIEVSVALDMLASYFRVSPCGCFESLRVVYEQIKKIQECCYVER